MDGAAERPLVGLFGAFDTGELGEVALRRVMEREIKGRRPDIDLIALAPFGNERPIPGDEGRPARPLRPPAAGDQPGLDALVITGDVLGDDTLWAGRYPVPLGDIADRGIGALVLTGARGGRDLAASTTWFAVGSAGGDVDVTGLEGKDVWARDPATQKRLGGTAVQSGDPLLLSARVFASETLRRRAELLRLCGAIPAGRRLVVETSSGLQPALAARSVEAMTAALRTDPKLSVVVFTLDPTREPAIGSVLTVPGLIVERVHRLPAWVGLDDIAAAMSGSDAALATSPAAANLAASLGVPEPVSIDTAMQTLDGAFAELAERLPHASRAPRPASAPDEVTSALAILQQRLVDERSALQSELSRVQSELDHLRASPEHRLVRPIREGYRRWQRRRT